MQGSNPFVSSARLNKVLDYMVRAWSWTTLIPLLCLDMQCALKSPALVVRSSRHLGSASSCYAALKPGTPLVPHVIHRRPVGAADVAIDIKFAGICHSDIHQVREEWAPGCFPMVPGHEITGVVSSVGEAVTKFKVGDRVGVGCMVDSCRTCGCCKAGQENYCQNGAVLTYNDKNKYPHCAEYNEEGGAPTYGGYSQHIVVDENYVCKIPASMDLSGAAPLLCAGITVYSPMKFFGLQPGQKLAVAGLGGLGAMAVLIGKAFGAEVTVLSRSESKREEALQKLKADFFVTKLESVQGTFDMIINTIAADHDVRPYISALKHEGKCIMLGIPPQFMNFHAFDLIPGRKVLAGSMFGGIQETQEMLNFCSQNGITCPHEVIHASQINDAYDRTVKSDVKYRFVIDAETIDQSRS